LVDDTFRRAVLTIIGGLIIFVAQFGFSLFFALAWFSELSEALDIGEMLIIGARIVLLGAGAVLVGSVIRTASRHEPFGSRIRPPLLLIVAASAATGFAANLLSAWVDSYEIEYPAGVAAMAVIAVAALVAARRFDFA
jgi:hypothetical protein